jgi:hypothetical protein
MTPMPDDSKALVPDALTFDLEAYSPMTDPRPDTVVVKYEYVVVDAEKQTTRGVISTAPWEW